MLKLAIMMKDLERMTRENSHLLLFYYGRERLKSPQQLCRPVVMLVLVQENSSFEDLPSQWEAEQ
jgi:hypothetical protein